MIAGFEPAVTLYPYQGTAVDNSRAAFDEGDSSVLVVMPTGSGKTYVAAELARLVAMEGGRTLFLAHRGELLTQALRSFVAFGLEARIEKGDQRVDRFDTSVDVVVASKDSLKGRRLERWPKRHFRLIITDEAHHAPAATFRRVYAHFEDYRHLGLTATPERGDGKKLGSIFPRLAFEYPLTQAIDEGFLVEPILLRPPSRIDLSGLNTSKKGDFNRGDLEDEIGKHVEELVNLIAPHMGDRPAITFTPDINSATAFNDGIRQLPTYGVTSRWVCGKSKDRDVIRDLLETGEIQHVSNAMLYTEGFDVKRIACVTICRPTKSGVLYRQMVGRGLRLWPGKENCLVIDPSCVSGTHSLINAIDLFDTTNTDVEVLATANRLVNQCPMVSPLKALRHAERIHRQRAALRVSVRERESRFTLNAYDAFDVGALLGIGRRTSGPGQRPLKEWQRRRLAKLRINAEGVGEAYANRLFRKVDERRRAGLCTARQKACLMRDLNVPEGVADRMSFEEASARIAPLYRK